MRYCKTGSLTALLIVVATQYAWAQGQQPIVPNGPQTIPVNATSATFTASVNLPTLNDYAVQLYAYRNTSQTPFWSAELWYYGPTSLTNTFTQSVTLNPKVLNGEKIKFKSNLILTNPTQVINAPDWLIVVGSNGPTNLVAAPLNTQVQLTWNAVANATSYKVKWGTTSGSYPNIISSVSSNSYLHTGLTNGTTYFYVVTAIVGGVETGPSNQAQATPLLPPPDGVYAYASGNSAVVTWLSMTGASSYSVLRGTAWNGPFTPVAGGSGITATSFTDSGLTIGTTYWYVVTATYSNGTSGYSASTYATTFTPPNALVASAGDGLVLLTWGSVTGATSYVVSRATSSGGPFTTLGTSATASYADYLVRDGTTYYYIVQAANGIDASGGSNVASATPQPAGQKSILFLVGVSPIPANTGDAAVQSRLANLGYSVLVKPAGGAAHFTSIDVSGKVLVAISATVNPSDVTNNWTGIATANVPIVTWQGGLYYSLGMVAGNVLNTDYGTIGGQSYTAVYNQSDPIITALTTLTQPVGIMATADSFTWAKFNNFGSAGATVQNDLNKVLVFDYEAGFPLQTGTAPARRVGLFLSTDTAKNLNSTGQALFDSAVQWAIGAPKQVAGIWATINNGQVTPHWEDESQATSYTVQRSTSPTGPFSPIATGISSTLYTDLNLVNGQTYYYIVTALNGVGQSIPSLVASFVPNASTCIAVIKGAGYVRRRMTGDPVDHWNSRVFTAIVYNNGGPVDPSLLAPQGANPWSITAGPANIDNTQTTSSCKVVASDSPSGASGTAKMQYAVKINTGTAQNPVWLTVPAVSCDVEVVPKIKVILRYHFPKDDGSKKTQWWSHGYPNLFGGDGPDTGLIRHAERNRLANDLTDQAILWDQATVEFYSGYDIEDSLDEKIDKGKGYWVGDALNWLNNVKVLPSEGRIEALNKIDDNPGVVNIYLVHEINGAYAVTSSNYVTNPNNPQGNNPFIVISDHDTLAEQGRTLCHELGHILGLDHSEKPKNPYFDPDLKGTINNVSPIFAYPYNQFLMYGGGPGQDTLTLEGEEFKVRDIAEHAKQGTGRIATKE